MTSVDRTEATMTVSAASKYLNVSESWIRRRIAAGDLPAVRLGTHPHAPVRIPLDDLHAWVRAATVHPVVQRAAS